MWRYRNSNAMRIKYADTDSISIAIGKIPLLITQSSSVIEKRKIIFTSNLLVS